jgi:hypothetical protein
MFIAGIESGMAAGQKQFAYIRAGHFPAFV